MGELDVSDILKDATIVYTFDAKTSQLQSIVISETSKIGRAHV